jgi:hypothetical protein
MLERLLGPRGELDRMLARRAPGAELSAFLDGLAPRARVAEVLGLRGRRVGELYDAMAGAAPLALGELVPADAPPSATFIFEGRNSLPTFSRFQKRFARTADGRLVGHNHQPWAAVTGPGYFVAEPARPDADVPGEPYLDYEQAPGVEPTGWPRYRPNTWGPSLLVFAGLKDYLRRVARGVVVGKAFRRGRFAGQHFVLASAE